MLGAGASVAFKIWYGNQYMVGIICPPELKIAQFLNGKFCISVVAKDKLFGFEAES